MNRRGELGQNLMEFTMLKIKSFFFVSMLLLLVGSMQAQSYLYFGLGSRDDYDTQTLLVKSARTDTNYSPVLWVTKDIGTVRLQVNCSAVSTSDSLSILVYGSTDDSTYTQITSPAFTTITAISNQTIAITACPKYIKLRYFVMGASSSFTFSVKAVAKYGY
jgi:hypothetical protein